MHNSTDPVTANRMPRFRGGRPIALAAGCVLATVVVALLGGPWVGATTGCMLLSLVLAAATVHNRRELRRHLEGETSLRRDLARLQTIVDNIPGLVGLWDLELRNRFANLSYREWFGRHPAEMAGMPLQDFLGQDAYGSCRGHVEAVLSGTETTFEMEFPCLEAPRQAVVRLIPHREDGVLAGFFSFATDITPIKKAQQAQSDSRARLEDIIDGATEFSIIATDAQGRIQLFSRGAERMLGYTADEMIGKSMVSRLHRPEEVVRRSKEIQDATGSVVEGFDVFVEAARRGEPESRSWSYIRKDGSAVPVHLVVTALHDHHGEIDGFLGVARDISREQEALRAIEEARQQAELSSRAKSEFVANMSHEIRTPLNAVLGMAQLLDKTSVSPNQRKYLDMIRKSGRSLLGIIDDILDFSKIEAGRMQLESMDFLLDDILENIANIASMNAAGKEIEVSITVDPGVPTQLRGDSLRLQQILVNLLGNAIKFTTRGEVAMSVEVLTTDERTHRIGFRIRDTGIGMTDEQQRWLFQPFSQLDSSNSRRYGGTGLGLAISKQLVEMMGGQIGVRSMAQIGTEFFLSLPFPHLQLSELDAQHLAMRPMSLLALERHPSTQASLEAIAARWSWKIAFVDDLKECLAQLERRETLEPVDAVIVDGATPGWDDRRSIREIRAACQREIPVIKTLRTAVENPADEGIRVLDGILAKPIVPVALLKILNNRFGNHPRNEEESTHTPETPGDRRRMLRGVRLLLVEDNAFNQVVATETLQALGAQVRLAENGKAAVELLRQNPKDFDLVLMDLQMPVMDGYAATQAIREQLRLALPVVAMTAGVLPSDRDRCKQAGMDDFIPKPFEIEDIVRVVRRLVALGEEPAKPEPPKKKAHIFQPDHLLNSLGQSTDSLRTVRSLVKQFLSTAPNSVRVGKECANRGDLEEALRAFHNLKSGAATLGALSLSGTAQKIESALLESERRNLKPLFDELAQEYDKVVAEAERWLQAIPSPPDTGRRIDPPSSRTESEF